MVFHTCCIDKSGGMFLKYLITALSFSLLISCIMKKDVPLSADQPNDTLPAPYETKSVKNFSNVIGWKNQQTPIAPTGFVVQKYADGFDNPRWMYVLPNGYVLVAESNANHSLLEKIGAPLIGANKSNNLHKSADRITLLGDTNQDGLVDIRETFLKDLNQPFGMLVMNDWFYVANTNGLWRYPYKNGATKITGKGEKIIDLPAGKHNRHWTRNIIANKDNSRIFIAIGSGSNIAEHGIEFETQRADIIEINPNGSGLKIYASGLRNPVGMAWAPGTNDLWTVVNERDELGDDLVPDYFTHVIEGGFYGWPYKYWGNHDDPRIKGENIQKTIVPDMPVGSHTASLGLIFYTGNMFPGKYHGGAFIVQHGSWNRSVLSGYKVIFIPFAKGKIAGKAENFLTGFIDDVGASTVHGRPVGVTELPDGSLLFTDDVTNTIWRVAVAKK
jgi:glucose/arabinose dehydrogenase